MNDTYYELIKQINVQNVKNLMNSTFLITGSTGLIGSCLVDYLMTLNKQGLNIKVIASGRNEQKARARFGKYFENKNFSFFSLDLNKNKTIKISANYIIHAGSNADPKTQHDFPVDTIMSNVLGTKLLLDSIKTNTNTKFMFISTSEVYGTGDCNFNEQSSVLLNSLNPRASYPISKIVGENLCASYHKQYGVNFYIVRPGFIFGPNFLESDSRVIPQFVNNVLNNQDILMKSEGTQRRSYLNVFDCVSAMIHIIVNGKINEIYNISGNDVISIKDIANIIAQVANRNVIFQLDKEYKNVQSHDCIIDNSKLKKSGWKQIETTKVSLKNIVNITKEYRTNV